jgi:F0F1-type ATP synthase assembly protein I
MLKRHLTWLIILLLLGLCFASLSYAQSPSASASPIAQTDNSGWLGQLDIYAKVFGGVVAGLGTLFGLPLVILNFRKTRAEIRKLELEAAELQNKGLSSDAVSQYSHRIEIVNSDHNNIQILADPRFLAPLLLLLDFIFAWGILTLAGYVIGFFLSDIFGTMLTVLLAAILLVPIIREARRVRRVLQPPKEAESDEGNN